jgi:hypothetical protein
MSVQPLTATTALERTAAQHPITSEEPCFGVSNSTSRRA